MNQSNSQFPQIQRDDLLLDDIQGQDQNLNQQQQQQQQQFQQEDQNDFENIMSNKFQEILGIQERKVKQLDKKLMEKEQENMIANQKYQELENEFNYNLQIIEQKDQDISDLVDKMKQLKEIMEEKQDQFKKLQYENESLQEKQQVLKEEKHDQEQILYDKIEEMKQEIKFFKQTINDNNSKHQQVISELQNKIKLKDQDLEKIQNSSNNELQERILQKQKQFEMEKKNMEILIQDLKENKQKLEQDHEKQSERLLQENEKLYKQLNIEKQNNLEKEKLHSEEILGLKQLLNEKIFNSQTVEKELENLKNANKNWEGIMKEKLDNAILEKQRVQDEYSNYKMKHKQKLKELKDTGEQRFEELIQEHHDKYRKLENQIRDLQLELSHKEMIERNLKEKMQERDSKYRKDLEDLEKKYKQNISNLEEDKRTMKNDLEIKEYHLKQMNEDKADLQKKFEENNKNMQSKIDKLSEVEKENKLLIEEVVRYRRDGQHQPKQLQPILEEKLRQSQKQKESQLTNNNNKNQQRQKSSPKGNSKKQFLFDANLPNQNNIEDDIFGDDDSNEVISQNYEKVFSEDQGPVSPLRSMHKDLFSQKFSGFQENNNNNPLQNNALRQSTSPNKNISQKSIQMMRKMKELEVENNNYKILISNMTKEIESIQNQTQFDKQELNLTKEENLHLRNRLSEFQYDMMNYREKILKYEQEKTTQVDPQQLGQIKGQLENKEQELQTLKQKVGKQKTEIEKLKKERETLIDISNNLKSKLTDYEDCEQGEQNNNNIESTKFEKLQVQNEIAYERIQELEGEIKNLRIDLKKWQILDEEKQTIIEQLKVQNNTQKRLNPTQKGSQPLSVLAYNQHQKRREMTKSPPQKQQKNIGNKLPKYDNFMDIDEFHKNRLNQFQQELKGIQNDAELNQNLQLLSQQKPLIQKGENDPRDNSAQYKKISERNTAGQKLVDDRLKKQQIQRKASPQQGKNYNIMKQTFEEFNKRNSNDFQEENQENNENIGDINNNSNYLSEGQDNFEKNSNNNLQDNEMVPRYENQQFSYKKNNQQ